jgi:hypothetical protein
MKFTSFDFFLLFNKSEPKPEKKLVFCKTCKYFEPDFRDCMHPTRLVKRAHPVEMILESYSVDGFNRENNCYLFEEKTKEDKNSMKDKKDENNG